MAQDHSLHLDAEHAIHRVLGIYSHILDNQRWSELDQVFTDDAVFTIEPTGVRMGSLRAIIDRFSVSRHPLGHHFTNPVIDVAPDGKSAKVVIKLLVVRPDGLAGTGSYEDQFVLTPKGWRITKRAAKVAVAKPDAAAATKAAAIMPGRPRLALGMPPAGGLVDNEHFRLIEIARQADAAGVDELGVSDHVVMGERLDRYRWGPFPAAKGKPWLEPLTLIATMAGATRRIRFMTGILIAPLRPATLLAKTLATIDQLSQGRLDVGVGTGIRVDEPRLRQARADPRRQHRRLPRAVGPEPRHLHFTDAVVQGHLVRSQALAAGRPTGVLLRPAHEAQCLAHRDPGQRLDSHHGRERGRSDRRHAQVARSLRCGEPRSR